MASQPASPLPEDIRDAAARLVSRAGPGGFTMDDLARASGVARATLYRQVRSREAVLAALRRDGVDLGEQLDVQGRILAAARAVFSRAGFDAATLEEVAREAGVGAATVYRQFRDKDGLIRAFIDRFSPRRAVAAVTTPTGDLRADLERVALTLYRTAAQRGDLLKLAFLERLRGGRWARLMESSPISSRSSITRLLKAYAGQGALRAEDPRKMAHAFAGLLAAPVITALLAGAPLPDPEETARFVTSVFLDGLATPAGRRR